MSIIATAAEIAAKSGVQEKVTLDVVKKSGHNLDGVKKNPLPEHPSGGLERNPLPEHPRAGLERNPLPEHPRAGLERNPLPEHPHAGLERNPLPEHPRAGLERNPLPEHPHAGLEGNLLPEHPRAGLERNPLPEHPKRNTLSVHLREMDTHNLMTENGRVNNRELRIDNLSIEEKQVAADETAKLYNNKYQPYERARQKGLDGVTETANGGVSFENSDVIYQDEKGNKANVKIEATGNRSSDFDAANKTFGLDETPQGYVWHHVDNYDVKSNTINMQLVKSDAHNTTKPHSGGCAQYDAAHGPTYNPPRKDVV